MTAILTPELTAPPMNGRRITFFEPPAVDEARNESSFHDEDRISITPLGALACETASVVPDADDPDADDPVNEDLGSLITGDPKDAPEPFQPRTASGVDWVLGAIADHKARAARIRANGEAMARAEDQEAAFLEMRYGAAIQEFVRKDIKGTRHKSVRLYHGVIGFRQKPAHVEIGDPAKALAHAKEYVPDAVVERLDRRVFDKALLEAGEVVEFAALVPAADEFYIKTNQGEN